MLSTRLSRWVLTSWVSKTVSFSIRDIRVKHVLTSPLVAGVLKPRAARLLIGTIREKYPNLPIHVHTHDSAGTGVASMVACAEAGADAVDAAIDSMSGMTSQPSLGAILSSLEGTDFDAGLDAHMIRNLDAYWAQLRLLYSPFEAGLTGPDPEVWTACVSQRIGRG